MNKLFLTFSLGLGLLASAVPSIAAGFQAERGRQSDGTGTDAIFADDLIRYTRLFVEPAFRLKGGNTSNGKGIEAGIIGAHEKYGPAIGLSVGYYQFDSKNNSDFTYRIVPVMLRAGGDILLTPGGTRFALWVGGGYSLNNYSDNTPGLTVDVDNSYVLMGQVGLKFPISNYLAVSVLGGYQYLKPLVTVKTAGTTTSAYTALDAGFVKLAVEF